jgi:hypothetical protein
MTQLTERDLEEIRVRAEAATPGPWKYMLEGRDHTSGDSFIKTGTDGDRHADLYLNADGHPATDEDCDFVANARQDIPRLLQEVERLRKSGGGV